MERILTIGNISVYLFGLTVALGLLSGIFISYQESKRRRLDSDSFFNFAIYSIIVAIVSARIFYIFVFDPKYYMENPKEIFHISNGGLSIQGALFGTIIFGLIYSKFKKISFYDFGDVAVLGLSFGQFIGRIGCDVYGKQMASNYPWGIWHNGQLLHPVQIYEAVLDLVLFTWLMLRRKNSKFKGQLLAEYIIGFAIIRGIVEFFRINPAVVGDITVAHISSLGLMIVGLIFYFVLKSIAPIREERHKIAPKEVIAVLVSVVSIGIIGIIIFFMIR